MKRYITLSILLIHYFFSYAQNKTDEYVKIIDDLVANKLISYDTIHETLKTFENDTVKMNYLIKKSREVNYLLGISYGLHGKGMYYANRRIYKNASVIHEEGLAIARQAKNPILQILHLNKLGALNKRTEKVRTAIDYYLRSLEIAENTTDSSYYFQANLGRTKNSIGSIYMILQQYEKSIDYFNEAISIHQKLNNTHRLAVNNQNIGVAYEEMGFLDKAFEYYEKALDYDEQLDSDFGRIISKNSMAQILIKKGNYALAENLIEPLIPRIRKTEYPLHISSVIINYGWVNLELGNLEIATQYINEAIKISEEYNLQRNLVKGYTLLSDLELKKQNPIKALNHFKTAKKQNDKVINDQNNKYLNDLSFKYDTEIKNNKINRLASENKIVNLKLKQNRKLIYIISIAAFLTLLGFYIAFVQRQRHKNQEILSLKRGQQVKTLELLMEGEEKERFRIAKELHDGVNVDLSAIKYKLTSLLEKNNEVINEAVIMIDKSCEQVRAISHNLVPPALKNFSLVEALDDYCSTTNAIHDSKVSFQTLGTVIDLSKKVEVNIFRIVQELVNNSIKHADASEIVVQISYQSDTIQLTVEDNGKGFATNAEESDGIGLKNVKSRVSYLNAKVDVTSDDKGTSFVIDINTNTLA
ncbi:tetratricopeptide repeat-containing sensor histidine kinase [Winogradskyella flava]|uniref:histidine kinase n=1 Tax=Winogradskyella flava TaxID=1884876 RepID=A0A842ITP3_9FLAO|nr:sensor histidine kinase [Winogradskyella flava]MBC2845529.1 sensor histidine kinase [Winogradskyella flava]